MYRFDCALSLTSLGRLLSLLAAFGLVVGVAGCGKDDAQEKANTGTTKPVDSATNSDAAANSKANTPSDNQQVASKDAPPKSDAANAAGPNQRTDVVGKKDTSELPAVKPANDGGKPGTGNTAANVPSDPQPDANRAARMAEQKKWAAVAEDVNYMKQIALAFHNYHDVYKSFLPNPADNPAYFDETGKLKVSWRVHLLPFLEVENGLYDQFKLDEPWDSPNNKPLLAKMPDIFRTDGDDGNKTRIVGFVDSSKDRPNQPTTAFPPGRALRIQDVFDGTSNTILFVKAPKAKAVDWSAPDDFAFDPAKPEAAATAFAKEEPGVLVALMDGSVLMLKSEIPAQTLARMIDPRDGELVEFADLIVALPSPLDFIEPKAGPMQLAYMHRRAVATVIVHPKAMLESPLMKSLLSADAARKLLADSPFDISIIEDVVIWLVPDDFFNPAYFAVRTTDAKSLEIIRGLSGPMGSFKHDERTLLFASDDILQDITGSDEIGNPALAELLSKDIPKDHVTAVVSMNHPIIQQVLSPQMLAQLPLPPNLADDRVIGLLTELKSIRLTMDLNNEVLLNLTLNMSDADSAGTLKTVLINGLDTAKTQLAALPKENPDLASEMAEIELAKAVIAGLSVVAKDIQVSVLLKPTDDVKKQIAEAIKVGAEQARTAAARSQRMNNLKQIGLAFHNYHDVFGRFAPADNPKWYDKDGKALLSWRVHLLPYLDQAALYQQFNLEEPWDSEHNKALLKQMPALFKTDGVEKEGHTSLATFTGENTPFNGKAGPKIQSITDGTSNTILVVEAGADKAVPWTKPADLDVDPEDPLKSLGKIGEIFQALFMDGAVRVLPQTIEPETLKALITPSGGEVVDDF